MSYLITVCDGCHAVALTPVPGLRSQLRACEACQHPLRVVPSRMYRDSERSLFQELSAATLEGCLSSAEAHTWSLRTARALVDGTYLECWESLTTRLPALIGRQLVIGGNLRAHERALQLMRAILEAVSTTRGSGMMPSVKLAYPDGAKTG